MMDTETKEAILKLAGYSVDAHRISGKGTYTMWYVVTSLVDILAQANTRQTAINLAYNAFLTRQNDVTETS